LKRDHALIFLIIFLTGAAENIFHYILTVHIRDLGAEPSQVGMVLSTAGLTMTLAFPIVGYAGDRQSHRKIFLALVFISSIPTAIMGVVNRWQLLLVMLPLFYLSWAVLPIANSYLSQTTAVKDFGRTFSTVHSGFIFSMVVFPSFGAWLATRFGMKFVFFSSAVLLFAASIPALFLNDPDAVSTTEVEYLGPLLSDRTLQLLALFIVSAMLAMQIGFVLLPNYLEDTMSISLLRIGQLGTVAAFGGAMLNLLFGMMRIQRGLVLVFLFTFVGYGVVLTNPSELLLFAAFFLLGSTEASFPLMNAIVAGVVTKGRSGIIFGVQGMFFGISIMIIGWIAGLLYENQTWLPITLSMVLLPLVAMWISRIRLASLQV